MNRIGIIAGSGQFPILFAKKLVKSFFSVFTIAYFKEANPEIEHFSKKTEWLYPGEIGRIIKFFKKNSVKILVILGSLKKTKIIKDIRPDIKALSIIATIKTSHDDTIISSFAKYLHKVGFRVKSPAFFLPELIAKKGVWTTRIPTSSEKSDIKIGLFVAKKIGDLDIGQSVVICSGSVSAIEAIEGTDSTVRRGGKLCNKSAVLVKICKPKQDIRFDMPSIGLKTIENMQRNNVSALAIESNYTIVFDKDILIKKANNYKISIICI